MNSAIARTWSTIVRMPIRVDFMISTASRQDREGDQQILVGQHPILAGHHVDGRDRRGPADARRQERDHVVDGEGNEKQRKAKNKHTARLLFQSRTEIFSTPYWKISRLRKRWIFNLEHDPEKWNPVFGQDHAQNEKQKSRERRYCPSRSSPGSFCAPLQLPGGERRCVLKLQPSWSAPGGRDTCRS